MDHLFVEWGWGYESARTIVEVKIAVHAMFMASARSPKPPNSRAFP